MATADEIAAAVPDPELPMLTLADLGVLRRVEDHGGTVTVVITPTYTGCPALGAMRDDLVRRLNTAGYADVRVEVELTPAWSTDCISERGRQALAAAGIAPPGPAPRPAGPVPLTLVPARHDVHCPRCGSPSAELISHFGSTPCQAVWRCGSCLESFGSMKGI
jgi:ring-1,2-phenylacetyl-CoA epoxidase subunit PaaD